jgi:hypothetical protein
VEAERAERDEFLSLRSRLASMGPGELVQQAEALAKDRERFDRMLDIGIERLRDLAVYHETGDERLMVYPRPGVSDGGPEARASVRALIADMDLFVLSRDLLGRRVSGQLVAENLFLKLGRG